MSKPSDSEQVKLISSVFSNEKSLIEKVLDQLEEKLGPIGWKSPWLLFDRTRYYEREMGWPLHRLFIFFKNLITPEDIIEIKIFTNSLENEYRQDGKRRINIDPGYISLERLVLATGKNYTHRIYLSKGIYADLTLIYHRGSFRPLEWTYKDYTDPNVISFLNSERERYKMQIRGIMEV